MTHLKRFLSTVPLSLYQVEGVFAGWTASNVVATSADIADLSWEIWAEHSIAPQEMVKEMIPGAMKIYGLGAFNAAESSLQNPFPFRWDSLRVASWGR